MRRQDYEITLHAIEEMYEDELTIDDVEYAILSGEILERQRNIVSGEPKFRIHGESVAAEEMEVIAKISPTGRLVVITVYLC